MNKFTLAALSLLSWMSGQTVSAQTDTSEWTDVTASYIEDAECENLNVWSRVNSTAGGFQIQGNNGMGDNNTYIECYRWPGGKDKWNNTMAYGHDVFDIHQSVSKLPAGKYRLTVYVIATQQNEDIKYHAKDFVKDVYLYANGVSVPVATNEGTPEYFTVEFYHDGNSVVDMGCKNTRNQNFGYCSSGCNWFGMDKYKLEQAGTYSLEEDLAALMEQAKAFDVTQLNYGLYHELQSAISGAENNPSAGAIVALQKAVSEATITVERSLSRYTPYAEAKGYFTANDMYAFLDSYNGLKVALDAYEQYTGSNYADLEKLANDIAVAKDVLMDEINYDATKLAGNTWGVGTWYKDGGNAVAGVKTNSSPVDGEEAVQYDERWTGEAPAVGTDMIYQEVNLPAGFYTVSAGVFGCRSYNVDGDWNNWDMEGVQVAFFANGKQSPAFTERYIHNETLTGVDVTADGKLRLGMRSLDGNTGGNWVGVQRNTVVITYEGVNKSALAQLTDRAKALKEGNADISAAELDVVISASESMTSEEANPSQQELNDQYTALKTAIDQFIGLIRLSGSTSVNDLVLNPSGEDGNTGWKTDVVGDQFFSNTPNADMMRGTYTKSRYYQNYATPLPQNTRVIYQTITGVPDGYYKMKLYAFARNVNGADANQTPTGVYAFLNDGTTYIRSGYMEQTEVVGKAKDGAITFGLETKDEATVRWTGLGDVQLEYMGTEAPEATHDYVDIKDYEKTGLDGWNTDCHGPNQHYRVFLMNHNDYDKHCGDYTGSHAIELWHNTTMPVNTKVLYQTVENLEPGVYEVSAWMLSMLSGNMENLLGQVYLYGNGQNKAVAADNKLTRQTVECVVDESGKLEFGVRTGNTPLENINWLLMARVTVEKKNETVDVILDQASDAAETMQDNVSVLCNRTLLPGTWNTLCLPYAVDATDARFTEIRKLGGVTVGDETYTLNFTPVTQGTLEAGLPYVVKVDVETQLYDKAVSIVKTQAESTEVNLTDGGKVTMVGTFSPIDITPEDGVYNYAFGTQNEFWYLDVEAHLKGYRSYIKVDLPEDKEGEPLSLMFGTDDTVTGLDAIHPTAKEGPVSVYGVSGLCLRRNVNPTEALNNLPAGIYIVNGKKYVVK
ncbi:MAG: hypothetical protein NC388_00505 [Clostridium sp.]|nr:hypothetical protein [Clostridium sp.]